MAIINIKTSSGIFNIPYDGSIEIKFIDGTCAQPIGGSPKDETMMYDFFHTIIDELSANGHVRTSETYMSTLNSFWRYRSGEDIRLCDLSPEVMENYEHYLKQRHITLNTISFYMRRLRAVYHRAVARGITADIKPFANVHMGICKTVKRAISMSAVKAIQTADLPDEDTRFARDMFMFSFYTRGMSFVDMAYLKKSDLKDGILKYMRSKTGQTLKIKWKDCMKVITDRNPSVNDVYLLPIINKVGADERRQYKAQQYKVNKNLKKISTLLNIGCNLTMYVARHSWASAAKELHIPMAVISDSMGHESEKTTQIYLDSIDANTIDDANDIIIDSIL